MADMSDNGHVLPEITPSDIDTEINHEPRVHDTTLAAYLGYADVKDLRALARRHREALKRFGEISTHYARKIGRGRPEAGEAYNRKQALYLCAKSDKPNGAEKTIQMVEVFDAVGAGATPGLSPIEAEVVGQLRRMTPAQRDHLRAAAVAGRLKSEGSPNAPGAAALPPPPAEPFFCTGCAVRSEWFSRPELHQRAAERSPDRATPADIRTFPMLSGPITTPEVDLMAAHRLALQDAKDRHNAETVRAVAAALGVPIDAQDPPGAGRRLAPPKKGA